MKKFLNSVFFFKTCYIAVNLAWWALIVTSCFMGDWRPLSASILMVVCMAFSKANKGLAWNEF